MRPPFHFPKDAFLLELALEDLERFFDVVPKNLDFHDRQPLSDPASAGFFYTAPHETGISPLHQYDSGGCNAVPSIDESPPIVNSPGAGEPSGSGSTQLFRCFHGGLCYYIRVGFRGFSPNSGAERFSIDFCPERNLAVAVLRQAWHEAVLDLFGIKETTRDDYSLLKEKAIDWIRSDDGGFVYWCQLAVMNHSEVRQRLGEVLRSQHHISRDGTVKA